MITIAGGILLAWLGTTLLILSLTAVGYFLLFIYVKISGFLNLRC
jgi:hypothetical protein